MKLLEMSDPTLVPGSVHAASVSVPVSPAGLQCTAELFLSSDGGQTRAATSGPIAFTSTGDLQQLALPVTMPTLQGDYAVYLLIVSAGVNIGAYQGKENVIIAAPAANIEVDSVTVTPSQVNMGESVVAEMRCTNYGGTAGSKDIAVSVLDQYDGGVTGIIVPVGLAAGQSKDIQILTDMQLSSAVGHWTIVADGQSATLDVLGGNAGVTGVVISSDTGLPIQGATVEIRGIPSSAVQTDASGRFTIVGLDVSGVPLDISFPDYATQYLAATGLVSGTVKDIGTITLTLISAIKFVSVTMPAAGTYAYDTYLYVGFRVQNISSKDAIANLTVNGAGASLVLKPGEVSDWYGTPYPITYVCTQTGTVTLVAAVNGAEVGRVTITVIKQPTPNLTLSWAVPPYLDSAGYIEWRFVLHNPASYPWWWYMTVKITQPDGTIAYAGTPHNKQQIPANFDWNGTGAFTPSQRGIHTVEVDAAYDSQTKTVAGQVTV